MRTSSHLTPFLILWLVAFALAIAFLAVALANGPLSVLVILQAVFVPLMMASVVAMFREGRPT